MSLRSKLHTLHFLQPAGTSRGVLHTKPSYIIAMPDGRTAEASLIPGLSPDYPEALAAWLSAAEEIEWSDENLLDAAEALRPALPALSFALESLVLVPRVDTPFARSEEGISINGLIWMGTQQRMWQSVQRKAPLFDVLKFKVGAIEFSEELELLRRVRETYGTHHTIRLDANGAWEPAEALHNLKALAEFGIHSVEQPIAPGQWEALAELCHLSPIAIALDEELIGLNDPAERTRLLKEVYPHYLILKPSLLGGFRSCDDWIARAAASRIGWWATSALESNIGLEAIALWASTHQPKIPQGLGTGGLFSDNLPGRLRIAGQQLWRLPD